MKKRIPVLLATATLLFASPSLHALGFEVSVGGQRPDPWGEAGYKGTSLDLKNDLNFGAKSFPFARARLDLPLFLPNLYLAAAPLRFQATGVRSSDFRFGDQTFRAGVPFDGSLRLDHYDAAVYYGVPMLKTATGGALNVDFGLNLRVIDFKAEITQAQSGLAQSKSRTLPVPLAFIGVQVAPADFLKLEAELRGIAYGAQRYLDAAGRVKLKPLPMLFVAVGYKFQNLNINQSDVTADLRFGGPAGELGVEF